MNIYKLLLEKLHEEVLFLRFLSNLTGDNELKKSLATDKSSQSDICYWI